MEREANLFTGNLVRNITCNNCSFTNDGTPESFTDLMLHIPVTTSKCSLEKLIDHYLKPSMLQLGDQYICENCGKPSHPMLTVQLKGVPQFLTLTVLRFEQGYNHRKVMTEVVCDGEIKLTLQGEFGLQEVQYTLNAAIVHCGYSVSSGHYMCYARNLREGAFTDQRDSESMANTSSAEESLWFCFNDSFVNAVKNPNFHTGSMTPVILIYQRNSRNTLVQVSFKIASANDIYSCSYPK